MGEEALDDAVEQDDPLNVGLMADDKEGSPGASLSGPRLHNLGSFDLDHTLAVDPESAHDLAFVDWPT